MPLFLEGNAGRLFTPFGLPVLSVCSSWQPRLLVCLVMEALIEISEGDFLITRVLPGALTSNASQKGGKREMVVGCFFVCVCVVLAAVTGSVSRALSDCRAPEDTSRIQGHVVRRLPKKHMLREVSAANREQTEWVSAKKIEKRGKEMDR